MEENKALKEANEKLEQMSQDERMQKLAEWRQKAIWDENTEKNAAYKKGIETEKIETTKRLLINGTDISLIAVATGFSEEEIEKIKKKFKLV